MQQVNFKLTNVQQLDAFTLSADVYLTNIGANQLKLNAAQFGINVDSGCLPNGTTLSNGFVDASSQTVPPCKDWNFPASPYSHHLRFVGSPTTSSTDANGFPAQAPVLPSNTPVKLGTFTIQSNLGFVAGTNPKLTLQGTLLTNGGTVCAAPVYVNGGGSTVNYAAPNMASVTNDCNLILS